MADQNSILCPKCKQRTAISLRATKPSSGSSLDQLIKFDIAECNNCNQHFLVLRNRQTDEIVEIYPNRLPELVDAAIPERIQRDLEEALVCFAAGAPRAAVVMARRAMQNICLDKGAPGTREVKQKSGDKKTVKNDLIHQIDWLYDQRIVTAELKDWAHEIRSVGNTGAHPGDANDIETVTTEDAQDILDLVKAFCQPLYVASRKYADRQARQTKTV